jgi:hypothetical protein
MTRTQLRTVCQQLNLDFTEVKAAVVNRPSSTANGSTTDATINQSTHRPPTPTTLF